MDNLQLGQDIAQSGFTNNFLKHAEAFRLEVLKQQLKDCEAAECTTIAAEITVLEELNTKNLTQRIKNIVFPDPMIHVDANIQDTIIALKGNDTTSILRKPIIAHAYVEITDTETGEQVILRAGPAGGVSKGILASSGASSSSEPNSYSNSSTSGRSQGSSSGGPGGTIKVQVDPIADSPDTAYQNNRPNVHVETLATATISRNFSDTVAAAESFAQSVNDAGVNYDAFYTNSNSTAATGFEQLTGQSRRFDLNYPGLGTDLCKGRVEC